MSDCNRTLEEVEIVAAAKGLVVVVPGDNELFIDIDSATDMAAFLVSFEILREALGATYETSVSPSDKADRFHITVTMSRPVNGAHERILLQALLGSDRKHEALSYLQAEDGSECPSVFFEKPEVASAGAVAVTP